MVTSVAVPKLPLPRTLTRRYRSMAEVRFSRMSRHRKSSASESRGAGQAIERGRLGVVRSRKSPECRGKSTGEHVRRTEHASGGCADGCALASEVVDFTTEKNDRRQLFGAAHEEKYFENNSSVLV